MSVPLIPLAYSPRRDTPLASEFVPRNHALVLSPNKIHSKQSSSISCSLKTVRSPCLDRHVVKQNKTRFMQKLKTLLLSKPKHFIPLHILSKCRSYLSLTTPVSILSMIRRYPTIFELFSVPWPAIPLNATKSYPQLCVRLTPAAEAIAARELRYKASIADTLADKLQKLLMMSDRNSLLLSKLVHIAPDLGLPPNFRSRLCNDYPEKFRIVDTSYGRALVLVSWDENLAKTCPPAEVGSNGLIVDRPLKFKKLTLRKGLNVKRRHRDFLLKFQEVPEVCPYGTVSSDVDKGSLEAEKRGCAVVREVLAMAVEKRTLIDHLTHFRSDFGLSNKLRGMIVRHPEMFYVSVKGLRDSVMLVEGYDEKGRLLEKDESLEIKEMFMDLVWEGKRMRREMARAWNSDTAIADDSYQSSDVDDLDEDYEDGFESLFFQGTEEDYGFGGESVELLSYRDNAEFWTSGVVDSLGLDAESQEPW